MDSSKKMAPWRLLVAGALMCTLPALSACDDDGTSPDADTGGSDDIQIEGLTEPVSVDFDDMGVPQLRCATATDCAAALGYLHARDRFIQMEVRRSLVRGQLHQLVPLGDVAALDQVNRTLYLTRDGTPIEEAALESASEETLALFEAYSRGVNVWIGEAFGPEGDPNLQMDEFKFPLVESGNIREWTPEDSIASVVALVDSLTNSSDSELTLGELAADFSADSIFDDLYKPRPISDSIILDDFIGVTSAPLSAAVGGEASVSEQREALSRGRSALAEAAARLRANASAMGRIDGRGSNNWVIGPDLTASGNAILTNDPHLSLSNPAIWYLAEMQAEDGSMNVQGVTFAGVPWVLLGQNNDLAWGATTTYFDQADVYIETLTEDGNGVVFNGQDVDFIRRDNTVTVDGTEIPGESLIVPHHGPVISIDEEEGVAYSLRWTGQDLATDVNFLTLVMNAASVEEARDAAEVITTLGQNWVFIDTQGNIGWFPYNRLPIRDNIDSNTNPQLPLPGDGDYEWIGFLEYEDLPQAFNPEQGYLATANGDMTGALYDGDPTNDGIPVLQTDTADGIRQQRIEELIEATDEHTLETSLAIVGDNYSLLGEILTPEVLSAIDDAEVELSAEASAVDQMLRDWDYECITGLAGDDPEGDASADAGEVASAQGCLAFHLVLYELRKEVFDDELVAAGAPQRAQWSALYSLVLEDGRLERTDWFDDVTTEEVTEEFIDLVLRAYESAYAWMEENIGDDESDWLWGRVHRLSLLADLFGEFGVMQYDNGFYARDGGLFTVQVANPSGSIEENFDVRAGASMRLNCEGLPEGMSCSIQLPGGQVHFRDSPYYDSFLPLWLSNEPTDFPFNETIASPSSTLTFSAAE